METFTFLYHLLSENYPESSVRVQFGRGYEFASAPDGPDQIEFVLSFPGMWFYLSSPTGTILNVAKNANRNMGALLQFYERHRMHKTFIYPHRWRGNCNVRFSQPLAIPKGVPNAGGLVEPFELKLKLQP